MPRYFFHVCDQDLRPDDTGIELPNMAAARAAAIEMIHEILDQEPAEQCRIEVSGSPEPHGRAFFTLQFSPLRSGCH